MGFFGIGGSKKDDEEAKSVQRSMDSVAVAKKRMLKSKSQRDAEEAEWEADQQELQRLDAEEREQQRQKELQAQQPAHVATYNPTANPTKPAVKSAMKKMSKFSEGS